MNRFRMIFPLLAVLTLLLSGCVNGRVGVDVNPDGSGTFSVAVGAPQEIMAMALAGEEDPTEALRKGMLSGSEADPEEVAIERWIDGNTEWLEASVEFDSPQHLNQAMAGTDLFEYFEIKREKALFKDRFVLDARLAPLSDLEGQAASEEGGDAAIGADWSFLAGALMDFQFVVGLPGEIVETNGVFANGERTTVSWNMSTDGPVSVHAVSEQQDYSKLVALAVIVIILGIGALVVAAIGIFFAVRRR